ncbi:MAG: DegV family EDD domain-containing protein [Chloroflexi bacterium]|nr:DegV family EDD domain-containing protein [Chloroflexota bacterium]
MAKVIIMTDTVACIPKDIAAKYNIHIVPAANIIIDGKNYIDGVTITAEDAYRQIEKDPDRFLTTAITPDYLLEEYRKLGPEPKEVLFISLSSALSAVGKTAGLAADLLKKEMPDIKIHIFDSKACAGTQGLLTLHAAKIAMESKKISQVIEATKKKKKSIYGLMMLDWTLYVIYTDQEECPKLPQGSSPFYK